MGLCPLRSAQGGRPSAEHRHRWAATTLGGSAARPGGRQRLLRSPIQVPLCVGPMCSISNDLRPEEYTIYMSVAASLARTVCRYAL